MKMFKQNHPFLIRVALIRRQLAVDEVNLGVDCRLVRIEIHSMKSEIKNKTTWISCKSSLF